MRHTVATDGRDADAVPALNFRQLAYLREVDRRGSVTAAAAALDVSQPALSQSLAGIEQRLGVVLFEGSGRYRRLTEDGREVLAFAEQALAQVAALQERIGSRGRGESGSLRVGMIDAASLYALAGVVRVFREAHPGIALHLTVGASGALLEQLRGYELDLAFVVGPAGDDMWAVELQREPLYLYGPPGRRQPSDDDEWVLYPQGSHTRAAIDVGLARLGVRPRVALESGNPEVLRQMVALGLGWSVLPPAIAEGGGLLRRRRGAPVAERVLLAARRLGAPPNPRAEAFLALAVQESRRAG